MPLNDAGLVCLMTGIPAGPLPSPIRDALRRGLAGVILFGRNVDDADQLRSLRASIRSANPRALIAIDEEGGGYSHLATAGAPAHVGNLALGVLDDTSVTRAVGYDTASVLAGFGINVDFAPDADANTNPLNPVIGVRSFGADPGLSRGTPPRLPRGRRPAASRPASSTSPAAATPASTPTSACRREPRRRRRSAIPGPR